MPVIRIDARRRREADKESPRRNRSSGFACFKIDGQMVRLPNSEFRSTLKLKIKQLKIKKYAFQ
jgi:hypothetical protein